MILVHAIKTTPRLIYILKFVLREICLFDFEITNSIEEFVNFKGAKINYSKHPITSNELFIFSDSLLFEKKIKEFAPEIKNDLALPLVFPAPKDIPCALGFDIFAASFYMVSRYEEYLNYIEDAHGRFEADQSFAWQYGFLTRPIIDEYAYVLKNKLIQEFGLEEYADRSFVFQPTYDIDFAYAFKGKGVLRNVLAFGKDIFSLNTENMKRRIKVLARLERDPFDTYSYQLRLQKKYKLKPIYFFLTADYSSHDKGISPQSKCYQDLIKMLNDYAQTGIHPSYLSHTKENSLVYELRQLSLLLNKPIELSRQHYLKMKLPETYVGLLKYNIKHDYTMGYASHIGFRAGTCTPFLFYNLREERETPLRLHPLSIMDASLKNYMKLSQDEAFKMCAEIIKRIRNVNGTLITLWHNDALCDCNHWKGWKELYEKILDHIQQEPS